MRKGVALHRHERHGSRAAIPLPHGRHRRTSQLIRTGRQAERINAAARCLVGRAGGQRRSSRTCSAQPLTRRSAWPRRAGELAASAASLTRDLDDTLTRMSVQGNTGLAVPFARDLTASREAFRDELRLCRELVAPSFIRRLRPCRRPCGRGRSPARRSRIRIRLFPALMGSRPGSRLLLRARADADRSRRMERDLHEGVAMAFDAAMPYALEGRTRPGATHSPAPRGLETTGDVSHRIRSCPQLT